ncbi:FxLYD domain-containing protein [Peribacillus alkalitolerans]|uniref:FxLYD domain-containing protein n=1 Tax=Peribacillus alkalitolerans TaxID=1550385 RepID=UPI0013D41017|nr:FxLYD domain-containing protein [Peribacillus alkalitolerans]
MYCNQCGEKMSKESRFCSNCGAEVQSISNIDSETDINEESIPMVEEQKYVEALPEDDKPNNVPETHVQVENKFLRFLPVLAPIVSILVVGIGLSFYFFQQKEVNADVLKLKGVAEESAINENYAQAKRLIQQALSKRPSYLALTEDLEVIEKAMEYEKILTSVSKQIQKNNFADASKEITSLKQKLKDVEGPVFENIHKQVEVKEIKITVGTIKKELNGLKTVDQLGGKLSILSSLPEKEASAVKTEIINRIVQISSNEVENELSENNFTEAFAIIEKGLQFAVNHEKLLSLKKRVEQSQIAFGNSEQQRIEQAMEAAAQEDLKNKTAAVQVSDLSVEISEYGDLYISGQVQNVATTSISSITVYFTIYDANNNYIDEGYATVNPYYLEPGEWGYFEDSYYGVYQDVNVEIDHCTWYLD